MATFVLIHGAMHGGWCWRPVEALLREAGHEVHAPTLTGMGERAHLLSPEVGVDTHVADVLATLRMEDVRDGVLVLHSYAGVLAGPVVQAAADRVARVVAMGAFLADPGECLADVEPPEVVRRYRQIVADGPAWQEGAPAAMQRLGIRTFAGYPLMVADRVVGVLAVYSVATVSEALVTALSSVIAGMALAIEDADRSTGGPRG